MPKPNKMVCSVAISVHKDNNKDQALRLYPNGDENAEPIDIHLLFPEHAMMSEPVMDGMMENLAHQMAEAYRQHLKQEKDKRIAKNIVTTFLNRAKQN